MSSSHTAPDAPGLSPVNATTEGSSNISPFTLDTPATPSPDESAAGNTTSGCSEPTIAPQTNPIEAREASLRPEAQPEVATCHDAPRPSEAQSHIARRLPSFNTLLNTLEGSSPPVLPSPTTLGPRNQVADEASVTNSAVTPETNASAPVEHTHIKETCATRIVPSSKVSTDSSAHDDSAIPASPVTTENEDQTTTEQQVDPHISQVTIIDPVPLPDPASGERSSPVSECTPRYLPPLLGTTLADIAGSDGGLDLLRVPRSVEAQHSDNYQVAKGPAARHSHSLAISSLAEDIAGAGDAPSRNVKEEPTTDHKTKSESEEQKDLTTATEHNNDENPTDPSIARFEGEQTLLRAARAPSEETVLATSFASSKDSGEDEGLPRKKPRIE
ncbi:Hypothetical protein D9617_8g051880 [Elsinoe fawcettii]|nr:Hypothetical protein D9617_8g051880 [Elsinoe fawcettii]